MKLFEFLGIDPHAAIVEHEVAGRFIPLTQIKIQIRQALVSIGWTASNQAAGKLFKCMKITIIPLAALVLCLGLAVGCARKKSASWESIKNPETVAQLKSFVAEKEAQANAATNEAAPGFAPFFAAAERGDWLAVSNAFQNLRQHAGQYAHSGQTDERLRGPKWQAIIEIWGGLNAFGEGEAKYSALYANDIIESIPPGSIYFGGTDPGRFLITAMQKNQVAGDPFFTLTQNALAAATYLDYLRLMYGDRLYIPTAEDSQKAFQDYTQDVAKRQQNHQLKLGENVQVDPASGRLQVSGQVAVMEINGLLVKDIFDKNTNQEFYVEESFPLDWMYPYLEPHGLIFQINRQPLPELSDAIVQRDHDYWTKIIQPMIGDWLGDDTSVRAVTDFARKVFLKHDFSGFTGDPRFVQNDYSCKMFSKERASIANLYVWRMNHAANDGEKERMARAADLAFKQALALCPYNVEAVKGYTDFLKSRTRDSDTALVEEMARQFPKMK